MYTVQRNLYIKLNSVIDEEIDKSADTADAELISEAVDGILRLRKPESYLITKFQKEENIKKILINCNNSTGRLKLLKILIAAVIIVLVLAASVFAYTVVEYNIHDYDTYSEVWLNMFNAAKKIDTEVNTEYLPENFVLTDSVDNNWYSGKTFTDGNSYITIEKYISSSPTGINTEFGKAHSVIIDGTEYIIYGETVHSVGVLWSKNGYMYSVVSKLNENILLKVAQGVS